MRAKAQAHPWYPSCYWMLFIALSFILKGECLEGKVKANLQDLLKFITGQRTVPSLGLLHPITCDFTKDERRSLPQVAACFNIVTLPLCHSDQDQFFRSLDQAVLYSYNHFGQE